MPDANQQAANALTLIERYGSFGLLCVIVIAFLVGGGLMLWYLACRLAPKVMTFLTEQRTDQATELEKQRASYKEELAQRDATCRQATETSAKAVGQAEQNTAAVRALTAEVAKLNDRTDEHRPHRDGRR